MDTSAISVCLFSDLYIFKHTLKKSVLFPLSILLNIMTKSMLNGEYVKYLLIIFFLHMTPAGKYQSVFAREVFRDN